MSILARCFPHSTSCTDLYASDSEYECIDDLFDLNRFTKTIHQLDMTIEGASKLGHYLLIMMWNFIFKSPMLFRGKPEHKDDIKILEKFVIERHLHFSQQFCSNKLFDDEKIELLNTFQTSHSFRITKSEEKENDDINTYPGEKKVKLSVNNSEEKHNSLLNYFGTITKKYIYGELQKHSQSEIQKYILKLNNSALTFQIEKLRDLVLEYFDYTPSILLVEDQDVNLYFIGMTALLQYFGSEIIELAGNCSRDNGLVFIPTSSLQIAVARDTELERTVFFHMNLLPLVDLNLFYGANQSEMPPININESTDNWSIIPTELHSLIFRHFSSLEDILEMRLVCKQWNYFIMNDNEIWKCLIRNSMIEESLFTYCDSSLTIDELETIISRGKSVKPLHLPQQVINYYNDKNDWKSLYFIIVRQHLTYLRDLYLMDQREFFRDYFEDYCKDEESFSRSKNYLKIGITKCLEVFKKSKLHQFDSLSIPKEHFSQFSNLDKNLCLVTVIDFSQYSCFISSRLLPTSGLLYCFYNPNTRMSHFLYFEKSYSEESLIRFNTNENTFKCIGNCDVILCNQEQIVVNTNQCSRLYYLQRIGGNLRSSLAPCHEFNNGRYLKDCTKVYDNDSIVLYSCHLENDEEILTYNNLAISISKKDLKERKFSNAFIYWTQSEC